MTHESINPFGLCGYGLSVTEVIIEKADLPDEGLRVTGGAIKEEIPGSALCKTGLGYLADQSENHRNRRNPSKQADPAIETLAQSKFRICKRC